MAQVSEDQVKKLIEEIRPNLQMDGGDIEFVKLEDKKVFVKLLGACAHCPSAQQTLELGVERYIKEKLPEIEKVLRA